MKWKTIRIGILFTLCLSILLAACGVKPNQPKHTEETLGQHADEALEKASVIDLDKDLDKAAVQAYQRFALKLYDRIAQSEGADNVFISPASIAIALSMTVNGADSATREAMLQALELAEQDMDKLNQHNQLWIKQLQNKDSGIELAIANSLWVREGSTVYDDFKKTLQQAYEAHIQELDFSADSAADTINHWVQQNTKDKIGKIVTAPIDEATLLFLINAIYFNGEWTHPFEEKATKEETFHTHFGTKVQVPMMRQTGDFEYKQHDKFTAIRLPYGEAEDWSMIIVLPNEHQSIASLRPIMMNDLRSWTTDFSKQHGMIQLPKFQLEYELELNDALKALGMNIAFDANNADFSLIAPTPPNLYIANVKHKSFIDVHEKGTEAAAVTSVEIRTTSMPMLAFEMIVDRPFYFAIEDHATGSLIFMGHINEL